MYKANSKKRTAKAFKKGARLAQMICIVRALRIRFEGLPPENTQSLKKIRCTAVLDSLFTCAMKCSTLDEFIQELKKITL